MPYETNKVDIEKAILVGLASRSTRREDAQDSLDELSRLAFTAGAEVLDTRIQVSRARTPLCI